MCVCAGGQAKTLMFIHISPEIDALGETLSTLKFAERVATVELGAARVNKDTSEVKELKEQVMIFLLLLSIHIVLLFILLSIQHKIYIRSDC